jgi:XisH protein
MLHGRIHDGVDDMTVSDTIHRAVKNALIKDGWTVTHDPYTANFGGVRVFADLAAGKLLAAERGSERIAVEIKSFIGPSPIHDFEEALGQFLLYFSLLKRVDQGRKLYLAISEDTNNSLFNRGGIRAVLDDYKVPRVVIRVAEEEIASWIV